MIVNNSQNKSSLGFLWGYKETQKTGNVFTVKTISGFNNSEQGYPFEHQNKKDFECCEIFEGDASRLSAEKEEFLGLVQESLLDIYDSDYYKSEYTQYIKEYAAEMSFNAFIAYKSAQLAQMQLAFSRLSIPHLWVQEYLSEFTEFKDESAYFACVKLDTDLYERQVAQALS